MKKVLLSSLCITILSLTGCAAQTKQTNHVTVTSVSYSTLSEDAQGTVNALGSAFGSAIQPLTVNQTSMGTQSSQKTYIVTLMGDFYKYKIKIPAKKLIFSVQEDGNKAWGLTAFDNKGHLLWQENDFTVDQEHLVFTGNSNHWKGTYHLHGVRIWTKNFWQYGSWEKSLFSLSYTDQDKRMITNFKCMLDDGAGSIGMQAKQLDLHQVLNMSGGGSGAIPNKKDTLNATIDWSGHTESFKLFSTGD